MARKTEMTVAELMAAFAVLPEIRDELRLVRNELERISALLREGQPAAPEPAAEQEEEERPAPKKRKTRSRKKPETKPAAEPEPEAAPEEEPGSDGDDEADRDKFLDAIEAWLSEDGADDSLVDARAEFALTFASEKFGVDDLSVFDRTTRWAYLDALKEAWATRDQKKGKRPARRLLSRKGK